MSENADARPLLEARTLRRSARKLLDDDVRLLRTGLAERPIGRRIRDRAADELVDAVDQVRDIAAENKAVVGGTLIALIGWFLRRPLVRGIEATARRLKDLTNR